MKTWKVCFLVICASIMLLSLGCREEQRDDERYIPKKVLKAVIPEPDDVKTINITMVAKSSANPVFLSARDGAQAAAKDLSDKYSMIDVEIDWRTPMQESPKEQAERILNAVGDGTDAIMVACSDKETLTTAINEAVDRGVPVMTFDSDAPDSKRFAFYGPNDVEIGEKVMNELAALIGEKGHFLGEFSVTLGLT